MDRYQFEGYISEYIENNLSIAKRKEFEQFLAEHPKAQEQVDAVKSTLLQLRNLPVVKTSAEFMEKLQQRVAAQRDVAPILKQEQRKSLIFGFTPLTATMMSLVVLAIVFVGYELLPTGTNPVAIPQQMSTNMVVPVPTNTAPVNSAPVLSAPMMSVSPDAAIAEAQEDSSAIEKELQNISPNLEDKINLVKTQ